MAMEIWVVKTISANFGENNSYFSSPRDLKIVTLARNSSYGNVLNRNNLHEAKAFPQRELLREVEEIMICMHTSYKTTRSKVVLLPKASSETTCNLLQHKIMCNRTET